LSAGINTKVLTCFHEALPAADYLSCVRATVEPPLSSTVSVEFGERVPEGGGTHRDGSEDFDLLVALGERSTDHRSRRIHPVGTMNIHYVPNLMAIYPIFVEMVQSGPRPTHVILPRTLFKE